MKTLYNLPSKVKFCKLCVNSNQRPTSYPEFQHQKDRQNAKYLFIGKDGVCDACKVSEEKKTINWMKRKKELIKLLDKFRSKNQDYDCIVPGSGGKDSIYAAHVLKYEFGMNPLTVTWPPILYTDYGYKNYLNWINKGGFDNITFKQNGKVMKLLTKLSIENLLHPFQTFILGQKNIAPLIAKKFNIPLIFYGENEAEYGNPRQDTTTSIRDKRFFSTENYKNIYLSGVSLKKLEKKYKLSHKDIKSFLPLTDDQVSESKMQVHYLGYYLKWIPQEAYYFAVEKCDFQPRPFRTEGTYSKYNSIDDKIDDLHYYTTFIKFGIGRATHDASQEIRNNHITRSEGKNLVKKFDGEYPSRYLDEVLDYLEIKKKDFNKICDNFRSPHLWKKTKKGFKLRHTINSDGTDDR
jgi:N-acetyl sugar amidotransferase